MRFTLSPIYQRWLIVALAVLCAYYVLVTLSFILLPQSANFSPLVLESYPAAKNPTWAWFKSQTVKVVKPIQKKPVVRKRNINARLLGIIKTPTGSVAIIDANKRNQSMVYREGDTLKDGIIIETIEDTRVLLNDNGIITSLMIDFKAAPINQKETQNPNRIKEIARLNKLMPRNLQSPLLAGVRFIQTPKGETAMSLGGINAEFLQGTDLQTDDIVMAAGGTPVERILASPNSYQGMLQQDRVEISVMRNGKLESVYVNPRAMLPHMMRLLTQKK